MLLTNYKIPTLRLKVITSVAVFNPQFGVALLKTPKDKTVAFFLFTSEVNSS